MDIKTYIESRIKEIAAAVKTSKVHLADGIKFEIYCDEEGNVIRSTEQKVSITVTKGK